MRGIPVIFELVKVCYIVVIETVMRLFDLLTMMLQMKIDDGYEKCSKRGMKIDVAVVINYGSCYRKIATIKPIQEVIVMKYDEDIEIKNQKLLQETGGINMIMPTPPTSLISYSIIADKRYINLIIYFPIIVIVFHC